MYTIKFKDCIAQQNNKTFCVTVSRDGFQSINYEYAKRLSNKELRTVVNRYMIDIALSMLESSYEKL